VREIIDHYQIILIARYASNRRSPEITVNKIKGMLACEEEEGKRSLTWRPNWHA
jgi:hypothetical protein